MVGRYGAGHLDLLELDLAERNAKEPKTKSFN